VQVCGLKSQESATDRDHALKHRVTGGRHIGHGVLQAGQGVGGSHIEHLLVLQARLGVRARHAQQRPSQYGGAKQGRDKVSRAGLEPGAAAASADVEQLGWIEVGKSS
jgi:hypothetical protein